MFQTHQYTSPLGGITLASNGAALIGLWFDGQKYFGDMLQNDLNAADFRIINSKSPDTKSAQDIFALSCKWLDIYFSAQIPDFTPPLALNTTPFRQNVWEILLSIPFGETMTYGQIAQILARKKGAIGAKMSARAVGVAVSRNPISLIIPCHRVIGSNGALTGYAGGIDKKSALLKIEGIKTA